EAIEKYASLEDREFEEEELSNEERAKFRHLGPITQREVEETDWDQLSKELSS
ncbi:MAG: hypothetical protein GWM98_13380, partial [Nitrospinaceae bacterium]|nr:hypothetical protein [Nitrospinaceae bacterium]NIR55280.1 hypothetical protein [Nitrospinaceae bacterium]NIS85719.1 hypothetical protein [Nitrospinaceae bacterium]NIT82569.1 hypothetical protein [Nitrospinaceae bacterium]NIU44774.1 hypothetical protein [Nitrospinaceae bacterium]